MAAKDKFHELVKQALINEGWKITHDPLFIKEGGVYFKMDIGAEKLIIAEKGSRKIAVEIKSFRNPSPVHDMQEAVGKYEMYVLALELREPDRQLYLAIPEETHNKFFQRPFIKELLKRKKINLIYEEYEY